MSDFDAEFLKKALKTSVGMVPHWYESETGGESHEIEVSNETVETGTVELEIPFRQTYRSTRDRREAESDLHENIQRTAWESALSVGGDSSLLDLEVFAQKVTLKWLKARDPSVAWIEILDYVQTLRERTHENDPVVFNAVLTSADADTTVSAFFDVTQEEGEFQKKIDPLATSLNTFFVLDKTSARVLEYRQVLTDDGQIDSPYGYPSVMASIADLVGESPSDEESFSADFSLHRTRRGDLLIVDEEGLCVTYRKGRWYLYDIPALRDTLFQVFELSETLSEREEESETDRRKRGKSFVGHLLDVVMDLSFRRHGALLVYDPLGSVSENLKNPDTIFDNCKLGSPHHLMKDSLGDLSLAREGDLKEKRHLLVEAASLDGAVLLNADSIISCGSLIGDAEDGEGNDPIESSAGARSTAAKCALYHGGIPIKVSEDGDVTVFFHPREYFHPDTPHFDCAEIRFA